jgi:predicted nucleotidyltransferase
VERVVLFGSTARDEAGLTSDLDLLIVWDTDLPFLERTAALYRTLQPQVAVDLLVYTP